MTDEMHRAEELDSLLQLRFDDERRATEAADAAGIGWMLELSSGVAEVLSEYRLPPDDRQRIWHEAQLLIGSTPKQRTLPISTRGRVVIGGAALVGVGAVVGYALLHNRRSHSAAPSIGGVVLG